MSDMNRLLYEMSLSCERNNEGSGEDEKKKETVPAAKVKKGTDEVQGKVKKEKANEEKKEDFLVATLIQEEIPSLGALVVPDVVSENDDNNEKRKEQEDLAEKEGAVLEQIPSCATYALPNVVWEGNKKVPAEKASLDNDVLMKEVYNNDEETPTKGKRRCYYSLDDVAKETKLVRKLKRAIRRAEKKKARTLAAAKLLRNGGNRSRREDLKLHNEEQQPTLKDIPASAVNKKQLAKVPIKNNKVTVSGIELLKTTLTNVGPSTSNKAQDSNPSTSRKNLQKAAMSTKHNKEQQTPTSKQETVQDKKGRIVKSYMMKPINLDYYERREERDYERLKTNFLYEQTKQFFLEEMKKDKMKLNLQQQEPNDSDSHCSSRSPDVHSKREASMQHSLKTQEQLGKEEAESKDRVAKEECLRDGKQKALRETNEPSEQSK